MQGMSSTGRGPRGWDSDSNNRSREMRRPFWLNALLGPAFLILSLGQPMMVSANDTAPDDLLWLEPPESEKALAWAHAATAATTKLLQASPTYSDVFADLSKVNANRGQASEIGFVGDRAIRLAKSAQYPKGLLQVAPRAKSGLGEWSTILDVAAYGKQHGKDFTLYWSTDSCLAPTYDRCLLDLHEAGGDESEIHEFDLTTGKVVKNGFNLPKARNFAVWLDADTVLVAHAGDSAPKTMTGSAREARVWKRGTPLSESRMVKSLEKNQAMFLAFSAGGSGQALLVQVVDYSTFRTFRVKADGTITKVKLPSSIRFTFGVSSDRAFVILTKDVEVDGKHIPADTILAKRLDDSTSPETSFEVVYTPQLGQGINTLMNLVISGNELAIPIRSGLKTWVDVARLDGSRWVAQRLLDDVSGVTPNVTGAGPNQHGFVVMRSGFLVPPRQDLVYTDGLQSALDAQPAAFDAAKLEVQLRSAKSRDGTVVPYFLVGPKPVEGKAVPTLMTGYGAFGISVNPAYFNDGNGGATLGGGTLKLWFERGGALVVPVIRGGGEFGSAFHHAAMREKRQNSYDDFHAVAENLVSTGYTTSKHLGVFGLSNGGLLAGVAGTQRPDLYGAIVSDVPLADMLRLPNMGMGAAWMNEYGDPSKPDDAAWLSKYSPVQAVKLGVKYPPFLVTVATTDNRVGPGHARKLAKRLTDVGAEPLYLEPEGGGHGVSDSLQRPDVMAMRLTFFIDHLMSASKTN